MAKTPLLEVEQQLLPGVRRLAESVADGDPLLATVRRDADDHQQTLTVAAFGAQPRVDPIDPPVDILRGGEVTPIPARMLLGPLRLQATDDIG